MEPTESHPGPPPDLNGRPLPLVETDQVWFRSHRVIHEPLHFGKTGKNRFDAPGAEFGVLYVAADIQGAFIESFGRELGRRLISLSELAERTLSQVVPNRPLRLVDVSGAGLARIGADVRLTSEISDNYANPKLWSLALHEHPENPDGILYRSRHNPDLLCVAIFERAAGALTFAPLGSLADPRHAATLSAILEPYRFGLIP